MLLSSLAIAPKSQRAGALGRRIAASLEPLTLEKVAATGFANARTNAEAIARGRSIAALRSTPLMQGRDALVVAAGPSLHRQETAATIRSARRENLVLIATDSAMPWCLRQGLRPDLVVTLDPHPHRIVRWFGDPVLTAERVAADDYYARQDMDPQFREDQFRYNDEVLRLINTQGRGLRIAVASCASSAVVHRIADAGMESYWWNPMYDDYDAPSSLTRQIHALNSLPCLNAGGNVGTACWVIAHAILGKRRVGLVGMDFGYHLDTDYRQTQYYHELVALVGADRLDEVFMRIRNPHLGRTFYTDPAYLWYRTAFLQMVRETGCETHNCTGGGILFGPEIRWTALREFLGGQGGRRAQGR